MSVIVAESHPPVGGKFLVSAADSLQNKGNVSASVYSKPVCPDVAKIQADEMAQLKAKWEAAGSPKGSNGNPLSGGLAGLLSGRGR